MTGRRIWRRIVVTLRIVLTLSIALATAGAIHAGETSLDFARAIQRGNRAEVERLLAAGEDPNGEIPRSFNGMPLLPLTLAIQSGHEGIAEALLDAGADVNAQDPAGATPLMAAALAKNLHLVRLLLDRGARVAAGDSSGRTALHYAARPEHRSCGDQGARIVEALLDGGALADTRDQRGRTPLMVASAHCISEITPLLARGADPNARDEFGYTPLHAACAGGGMRAVRELLSAGAVPGVQDDDGVTPMMIAAGLLRQDLMDALRKAGAPSNLVDRNGETAEAKFWTSEVRGIEPTRVLDPDLGVELTMPGRFGQGKSEPSDSGPRRIFSLREASHSAPFDFVVARLTRTSEYWTAVVRSCGLSSPETLYPAPPSNLQLTTIPKSPESGGREVTRADLLRGSTVCVSYGVELESDAGDGVLVAVAGAQEEAAPETLALLENVLATVKLGVAAPSEPPAEPEKSADSAARAHPLGRATRSSAPRPPAFLVFVFLVAIGLVLFLIWRSRQRPKVYVSDRLRPLGQERPTPRPQKRGIGWRERGALALGSATAIASAIFTVRVVQRLAVWIFSLQAVGFGWLLVNALLALALGALAWKGRPLARIVFGATLLLVLAWANLVHVPRARAALAAFGDLPLAYAQIAATHFSSAIFLLLAAAAGYSHPEVGRLMKRWLSRAKSLLLLFVAISS